MDDVPCKTLPLCAAYSLWAESYPPYAHNHLMETEQAAMLRSMPALLQKSVLDLGCGTSRYGLAAWRMGASTVIGIDLSRPMLLAGRRYAVQHPLIEGSIERLPFLHQAFNVVICGLVLSHLPATGMRRAIKEVYRVLRVGGDALFSDYHAARYARGGRRTIRAPGGDTYYVEHYSHEPIDYIDAIQATGMEVTAIEEPFSKTSITDVPAVLVIRARRKL